MNVRFSLRSYWKNKARARQAGPSAFAREAVAVTKAFILRPDDERSVEFAGDVETALSRMTFAPTWDDIRDEFLVEANDFALYQREQVENVVDGLAGSMEEMIEGISASINLSNQRVLELNEVRTAIDNAVSAESLEETRQLLSSSLVNIQKLVEREINDQRELWRNRDSYGQLLKSKLEYFEKQSRLDPLTGVANRAGTERHVKLVLDHCRTNKRAYSLGLLDLNGFKAINDGLGHQAGDAALVAFTQRLQAAVGKTGFVGRLGGDEFVVVTPTEPDMLARLLHRLNENLEERPIAYMNRGLKLSASFGVQAISAPASFEELHRLADQAMYADKQARKAA